MAGRSSPACCVSPPESKREEGKRGDSVDKEGGEIRKERSRSGMMRTQKKRRGS